MKMAKARWIERAIVSLNITNLCNSGIAAATQNGNGELIHNWNTLHPVATATRSPLVYPVGARPPDSAATT